MTPVPFGRLFKASFQRVIEALLCLQTSRGATAKHAPRQEAVFTFRHFAEMALVLPLLLGYPFTTYAENTRAESERNGLPLIFSTDFSTSDISAWEFTDPKAWELVEDGGKRVLGLVRESEYRPPVRSPFGIAWLKDIYVSDFVLEVDVRQTGREYGHRDVCVMFGNVSPSEMYYAHLATQADDHANSIFLVNRAPRVGIAKERTSGTRWDDAYHTVRVVRDTASGTITVYRDDMTKPIMVAEDKTFLVGRVGIGSFDDTANFAAVRLWGKRVPPPVKDADGREKGQ